MRYVFPLNGIPSARIGLAGGKAASLSHMMNRTKLPVPDGYVILADAFENGELVSSAEEEIMTLTSQLDRRYTYAVRSSALNEDGDKASFAGQYETVTDISADDVMDAVNKVFGSVGSDRVKGYGESFSREDEGIGIVVQRFVRPQFAGVIFTSDAITGKDRKITGNYVRGEGEQLVSGSSNAEVFTIDAIDGTYEGDPELARFSKRILKASLTIRHLYGMPMDIEWAISDGKFYILQARPITTLQRLNMDSYDINGTRSGHKLLTRTNVGEIFMKPVSPMTFSVLEMINGFLALPDWLDNICGQPYMNISVMCSAIVAFGSSEEKAFESIKDLVGNIPEGTKVPLSPFDKKGFLKQLKGLFFPKEKTKLTKKEKIEMVRDMPDICRRTIEEIHKISDNDSLFSLWEKKFIPDLKNCFAAILGTCGTSMVPLFSSRKKITKIAGSDMANRLLGGSLGVIDCMKPLLLLEDVIEGRITREEYIRSCGQRSVNEMELMAPRPYEDPSFPDNVIEEHKRSGADLHGMLEKQQELFEKALDEFRSLYPSKSRWIDREISRFARANEFREDIRSKGVWLFSAFREFILRAGKINGLDDDIFFLTFSELFALLKGDFSATAFIPERKKTYNRYLEYPAFPNVILGRFDPDSWTEDPARRCDFFTSDHETGKGDLSCDVKGFPGAAGVVKGKVRVITSPDRIDQVEKGEILVTVATNIGWTLVFPKVSAIITDIGAPLSHAAIVAREFGIPAVVGCGNATTLLRTGDIVEVDGSRGTVTKVG